MDAQERSELVEIIRAVIKAEIQAALEPYATRTEVQAMFEPYATRAEMQAMLEPYATRAETQAMFKPYATHADMQAMLDDTYDRLAASTLREFDDIRKRLTALEARVAKVENLMGRRLDNLDSSVSSQQTLVYNLRQEYAVLREHLMELEERITKLEGPQHG